MMVVLQPGRCAIMGVLLSKLAQRGRREEAHVLRERVESHRDVLDLPDPTTMVSRLE